MIDKNESLSVRRQCELLGINRSSLYYTPAKPDSEAMHRKEELMRRIDFLHTIYPYMGSRKLAIMLQREGYSVSRKIIRRLMAEMGICAVYPRANLSKRNFKESIVPYLLRGVTPYFPNQVWSIDITYIPLKAGHMYLTAIIDWYSRKIVGSYLSDTLDTDSVSRQETWRSCYSQLRPGEPVHLRCIQIPAQGTGDKAEHGWEAALGRQHHD